MKYWQFYLSAVLMALAGCSPKGPYAAANKYYAHKRDSLLNVVRLEQPPLVIDSAAIQVPSDWVGTVNFGIRRPNYVVIHYTAQDTVTQTLGTFTVLKNETSAHYVVAKSGMVYQMASNYLRANHAGAGKWGSVTDMNSCSIGIEIDNDGVKPYTPAQIGSLLALLTKLKKDFNIPQANFIGHQDFAPARKQDPGPLFPWKTLATHGFGFWSDEILELAPKSFDPIIALRLIGYDVKDVNAAILAFKRHFVQTDTTPQPTQLYLNVLYNVYKKY